jgi:hypothetical protein
MPTVQRGQRSSSRLRRTTEIDLHGRFKRRFAQSFAKDNEPRECVLLEQSRRYALKDLVPWLSSQNHRANVR